MQCLEKFWTSLLLSAAVGSSVGCGAIKKDEEEAKQGVTSTSSSNLTEQAADSEVASAEAEAATSDSATDTEASASNEPHFVSVVKAARDYTRKLLGLSDEPLKEFKSAVDAVKALSSSAEDFKEQIKAARDTLTAALEAQKAQAEQARVDHADELQKIFDATKLVFKECAANLSPNMLGGGKGGPRDPMIAIGSGKLKGQFKDLRQQMMPRPGPGPDHRPGFGQGRGGKDQKQGKVAEAAQVSAACESATDALEALIATEG